MTAGFFVLSIDLSHLLSFVTSVFPAFVSVVEQPMRVLSFTDGQCRFYMLNRQTPPYVNQTRGDVGNTSNKEMLTEVFSSLKVCYDHHYIIDNRPPKNSTNLNASSKPV